MTELKITLHDVTQENAQEKLLKLEKTLYAEAERIEKSHKYITRTGNKGNYKYEYPKDEPKGKSVKEYERRLNNNIPLVNNTPPIIDITNTSQIKNAFKELVELSNKGKLLYHNLRIVFDIDKFTHHLLTPNGIERNDKDTQERIKYLMFIPSILKYGKLTSKIKTDKGIFNSIAARYKINGKEVIVKLIITPYGNRKDNKRKVLSILNKTKKAINIDSPGRFMTTPRVLARDFRSPLNKEAMGFTHNHENNEHYTPKEQSTPVVYSILDISPLVNYNTPSNTGEDFTFIIHDFNSTKIDKALRTASFTLNTPFSIDTGEAFIFNLQKELTIKWCSKLTKITSDLYDFIVERLNLPKMTIALRKALLTHNGHILYNSTTGQPIKESEWQAFTKTLQNFLDNHYKDTGEHIVLDSVALSKILNRMCQYQTLEAIQNQKLNTLKFNGKTFDWISDSIKHIKTALGDSLTRTQQARIQVLQDSSTQRITRASTLLKEDIKQILIDGVKNREGSSMVSQHIFDRMVGHNRDIQKIADTEIQNSFNYANIQEAVYNTPPNEKTYFKRVEIIDDNTCDYCKKINGTIAVYSNTPLETTSIQDDIAEVAIWDNMNYGKETITDGTIHPYCRGLWVKYYTNADKEVGKYTDALNAELEGKTKLWNEAVKKATEEYKEKGINPIYSTPGYTKRINEIYGEGE